MASVDEPVALVPYDPAWPAYYQEHAAWLRKVIGADAVEVEHIGSTAVPGALAKPILDVMVGVTDPEAGERVVAKLVSVRYEDCGGAPGRRYLRMREGQHFNVQIIEYDSELWRANLVLRDYLCSSADAARRYGEAKIVAAERAATLLAYSELKSAAVRELLREARLS